MKFTYITLFPEIIEAFFENSIMKRAVQNGLISYSIFQIRDFAQKPYHACDDAPYGGGAGMLLKSEPLAAALDAAGAKEKLCVYPSPAGQPMSQKLAQALSRMGRNEAFPCALQEAAPQNPNWAEKLCNKLQQKQKTLDSEIIFLCGRYEGIDQRIIDTYIDLELSIGDYVLSSGELGSLCLTDAIYRLCDGVLNAESLASESFCCGLLEYPQYTRPVVFLGRRVPAVLLCGHNEKIRLWRLEQSIQRTWLRRPDLLAQGAAERKPEAARILKRLQGGET